MTDHIRPATLSALADGELLAEQIAVVQEHLAACPACTRSALDHSLIKSASGRAGTRYTAPQALLDRLAKQKLPAARVSVQDATREHAPFASGRAIAGWVAAAALLLVSLSVLLIQRHRQQTESAAAERASIAAQMVAEVADEHIGTLASSQPPQVISSDKHTVKPWFQGKLPFTFNLPDNLPADTRLEGANLAYLHNQPAAQLLYSIGRHRVSVFVQQRADADRDASFAAEPNGFHLIAATSDSLQLTAISDVDPARLASLLNSLKDAQVRTSH